MKGNLTLKRIGAYLIDYFIIFFISSALISISAINPKYDEYVKVSEEYNKIVEKYYDEKIDVTELNEKTQELSYEMNKTGYVYIIGDVIIVLLYFGVFVYATKGQTLGKKLMGLKIVRAKDNKELKIYNYLIRAIILNGVIISVLTLIALCFSKETYYTIYTIAANIDSILAITIFLMIMFYKDGRGLHDIVAGTRVIDLKYAAEDEANQIEIIKLEKEQDNE